MEGIPNPTSLSTKNLQFSKNVFPTKILPSFINKNQLNTVLGIRNIIFCLEL
jgi:hypothetical protein